MAEIAFYQTDCVYQWPVRYKLFFGTVIVRVKLVPLGVSNSLLQQKKAEWRESIRSKWSGRFKWRSGRTANFDIAWVEGNEHQKVSVAGSSTRSVMDKWDVFDSGDVASHEFGHMLGLKDEYVYNISHCSVRSPVSTGSIMDVPTENASQRLVLLSESNRDNLSKDVETKTRSRKRQGRIGRLLTIQMFGGNFGQRFRSNSLIDLQKSLRLTVSSDENFGTNADFERKSDVPVAALQNAFANYEALNVLGDRPIIFPGSPVAVLSAFVGGERVTRVLELKESQAPPEPGGRISAFDQFTPAEDTAKVLFDIVR